MRPNHWTSFLIPEAVLPTGHFALLPRQFSLCTQICFEKYGKDKCITDNISHVLACFLPVPLNLSGLYHGLLSQFRVRASWICIMRANVLELLIVNCSSFLIQQSYIPSGSSLISHLFPELPSKSFSTQQMHCISSGSVTALITDSPINFNRSQRQDKVVAISQNTVHRKKGRREVSEV